MERLDYLGIGAHPDDLEIFASGTFVKLKQQGYRVGFCHLSAGEMGTYGSLQERQKESLEAKAILDLDLMRTLDLADGQIRNDPRTREVVMDLIRQYKPRAVVSFGGAVMRHPDHYHTGKVVEEACFTSGLSKYVTSYAAHKPEILFQFTEMLSYEKPDFIVDISDVWEKKVNAIRSYRTQVFTGDTESKRHTGFSEQTTFIKSEAFWRLLVAKASWLGSFIGTQYAEGFITSYPLQVYDPLKHLYKP